MRRHGRRRIGLVAWALGVLVGCGPAASADIAGLAPRLEPMGPEAAWVEADLAEAVAQAHWLTAEPDPTHPELPLRVAVVEARTPDGVPLLRVETVGELPAPYRARFGRTLEAVVEVESGEGAIDPATHGALAVERSVAVLDAKVGLVLQGDAALTAILAADDGQIVALGLDWIAAHRARDRADDVARLVEAADPLVAMRAIECLALVGGPEHVDMLVRRPRLADEAYARRLYDTVAQLGGDSARGFLEFAARNEEDPALAEAAERALARVGEGAVSPAPDRGAVRGHR